jgi:hypothetical protein
MGADCVNVIEYITEEVRRQGHDIAAVDGIERVGFMIEAWVYAMQCPLARPTVQHAIELGRFIEPGKNRLGPRTVTVEVGGTQCPEPSQVPNLLRELFESHDSLTPLGFYKRFEEIHPFVDGNGRVGKVLYNWLLGTLHDPVFPPPLWGHPNV